MQPEVANPRKKWLIIGSIVVLIILLGLGAYYVAQGSDTSETLTTNATPASSVSSAPTATPAAATKTYFATGIDTTYTLTDVETGTTQTFTPAGYRLVTAEYPNFPTHIVLQKDQELYAYTVATKKVTKIEIAPLKKSSSSSKSFESAGVAPSFSEKDKTYIAINTYEGIEEGELGLARPTASKSYFYDFTKEQLTPVTDSTVPNGTNASCYQYDSKFSRFFTWQCGEGIGSASPLSTYDIGTKSTKEIVDKGNEDGYAIEANNGEFLAIVRKGSGADRAISAITRVKTDKKEITPESYLVSSSIQAQTADTAYSALFVPTKNLIIMGGSKSVTILGYDANKQITTAKVLDEPNIYANFVFTDGEKAYYRSVDKIKVVNLDTKQVVKSFATSKEGNELGLVALPE